MSENWVEGSYESGSDPVPEGDQPNVNSETGVGVGQQAEPATFESEEA